MNKERQVQDEKRLSYTLQQHTQIGSKVPTSIRRILETLRHCHLQLVHLLLATVKYANGNRDECANFTMYYLYVSTSFSLLVHFEQRFEELLEEQHRRQPYWPLSELNEEFFEENSKHSIH
jgi:hypothetical protein